jgi:hypothetical protein
MNESLHNWVCRGIVDRSGSAILFAHREGVIRLWNHGAEESFGRWARAGRGGRV